ncbi:ribonuclease H-like domain-containing protein [Tanacetum coccineum]
MQKYILKQQFEGFSVSNSEGLHKGYDRFQSLLSQLEIHRTGNDVNDVKGSTASSSSTQNVAFVSENTSSTNDVSTAYGVSNPSGHNSQYEQTSSYSLLANQSSCPQLDHEDLEQLDEFDLEEMDLKWQVAMISMRMKKFYKKTGRKLQFDAKEPVGFDKTKVECYSCHKTGHFARECRTKGNQDSRRRDAWNSGNKDGRRSGKQEDSKALVTIDGEGVDWTSHSEEEEDYALMACSSSGSDTEVTFCSKECKESYAKLKKLYDAQREQLGDASIEIQAYTQALKKVEAQLVAHQQGQLWYEEKIRFMKIDLDDKTDVLTYHKKLLAEAEKEKEDLKAKIEKWHNSSKNLSILLNSQMSANDKFGLGYGDYRYDGILSYENEVLQSVFMNKESDLENQSLFDRFVTVEGMHAVPSPMTGNYMPSGPDIEIDYSQFTYGPKQSQASESETQTISNYSDKTHESLPELAVNEPRVVIQPKVWSDAPIIEEYESDSEDEHVSLPTKEQETPSLKRPKAGFHKSVSPFRKSFNRTTTLRTNFSKQKVNTAEVNAVSAVKGKRETAVKSSAVFLDKQLKNVPVPLDHFPINALTSKVFSFMVKKGKHFSGKVTPLFPNMLVQPTEDEGEGSERPSEPQPIPSPPHPSTDQHETQTNPSLRPLPTSHITDSIPEGSGGNHGGQSSSDRSLSGNEGGMTLQSVYDLCISLCTQVTDQANEIKHLKAQIKKLKKKAKPVITHHRAWMKSVSMKQRLAGKKSLKKQWMQKESVSKQGRKSAKAEPSVHKDPVFDELDDDAIDYMETEDAQDVGRTRYVMHEEKESAEKEVSTEDALSTDKQKVSTDKEEVSTDRPDEGTVDQTEGRSATPMTQTPTPTIFGDDETIAQVLLNMSQAKAVSRENEKGVELKDVENTERPMPTSIRSLLTLKPLPKIDPKDKGKKKTKEDESDIESEDINESEKKFKMLAHDEEIARKMQEDWEAEEERKRLAEEEATNTALIQDFDDIKARIKADRLLALRFQEEREQFTMEERAKFIHDTIATQRRFLAEQRAAAIRNRPPTRTQLRSQMMTYLKHVGNKKHSDLKNKTFEEIQALYEKVKRFDESFTVIGSTEDERKIKEINEGASDPNKKKKFVKEDVSAKVPAKQDVAEQGTKKRKGGHMKMIARKRKRPQPDVDSDDEHRKCLKIVTFEGTIDSEIMERKSFISKLDKVSSPEGDYLVVYRVNGNFRAFNYLMEVLHIFDRQDLFHLYDLVMKQYSESTPEGIELILWGDLKIMMESSIEVTDQGDFWNDQQDWEIVTWRLYEACGVCILEFKDGTVIHMLVERKYPLSKELLQRMLDFGLEVEVESTAALDLIRVLNSPCFMVKSWLVQDQTVLGKDYSNLLIADSLLKTIWFINAPCYGNEALASPKANELTIPEQMATGKGISNPFMAGSLPKTTKPT